MALAFWLTTGLGIAATISNRSPVKPESHCERDSAMHATEITLDPGWQIHRRDNTSGSTRLGIDSLNDARLRNVMASENLHNRIQAKSRR